MIKIHIFHTGTVTTDKTVPQRSLSKRKNAYTGIFRSKKDKVTLPVSAYLIKHEKGLIVFDTGWHTDVRKHPIKHESYPLYFASKPTLPEGKAINEQLDKLNIKTNEIDYVILSHLDIDHVSGLKLVSNAKKIYASEDEINDSKKSHMRYFNKNLWKNVNIENIPFVEDKNAPFGYSWDIFNDNSIVIYLTRGHSKGSICIKVTNNDKFVLLVGDTGYKKESWINLEIPGPLYNENDMLHSLKWVKKLNEESSCIKIIANHDPEIEESVIEL